MQRITDTLYGLINSFTGEWHTYSKVTKWLDGSNMIDAKCDGTIFRKKGQEYFKLNWTGPVKVTWFGAKGDGVTDDSVAVQKAINAFKTDWGSGQGGGGQTILFPEGTFLLKDIKVPAGISLISYQLARDNFVSFVPSKIKPALGATYVFEFEDTAKNCEMIGIYIDAEYSASNTINAGLVAAVRWAGSFNIIRNCNFTRCPQHAVLSKCGGFMFEDNNLQGWYGPAPVFTSDTDFRGVFHCQAMGDSYIKNNEIGAGLPYFTKEGMDLLRDPLHRRICALAATNLGDPNFFGFFGNSVIKGNLFENGDRSVALGNGLYATFSDNRYELSGGTGLTIFGSNTYMTFSNERFSGNSMAGDGLFPDIELRPGTMGKVTFNSPIFFRSFPFPNVPAFANRVNYNVDNKASADINFVAPVFDDTYYTQARFNMSDVANLPVRQALLQYDVDNPRFITVSTQKPVVDTQTGYVVLIPGTTPTLGDLNGGVQFYNSVGQPKALIGFNTGNDLWYTLNQTGGNHTFIGGGMYVTKPGGNSFTLNSTDDNLVSLTLSQANATTGNFSITLQADHSARIGSNNNIILGLGGIGNIRIEPSGITYLPNPLNPSTLSDCIVVARNETSGEMMGIPASNFLQPFAPIDANKVYSGPGTGAAATPNFRLLVPADIPNLDGAKITTGLVAGNLLGPNSGNYLWNQATGAQTANFWLAGVGRIEGALAISTGNFPAYALQVKALTTSAGVAAQFIGTVIGNDAVNANEFVTKSQLDNLSVPTLYSSNGTITSNRTVSMGTTTLKFQSADEILFQLNGSTNMSYIGVKTAIGGLSSAMPLSTLDVRGEGRFNSSVTLLSADNSSSSKWSMTNSGGILESVGNQPLSINTNGNTRIYCSPNSFNVGFGVGAPPGTGNFMPTSIVDVFGEQGYSQFRLRLTYTPTSSADVNGNVGDTAWDNDYFYIKTNPGGTPTWKRIALSTF